MTNDAPYRLRLNGRVELLDALGGAVALRTRKTALLLAMLVLAEGEGCRRNALAEAVWEDVEPRSARESLRTALSALRSALGLGAIRASAEIIVLAPEIVALEDAEGEFMPGFDGGWVVERRLQHRALAVAEALAASHAAPDPETALERAERACAIDPLDTDAARRRVDLLAKAGRRADALAIGTAHRARVVRELGFVPEIHPPASPPAENPLVRTLEWTLERDPNEACALLAATSRQWLWIDVETALDAHRRVLAMAAPSRERLVVGAVESFLEAAAGRLDRLDLAAVRHRAALDAGEPTLAGFLCYPLAEGYAARGDFARAAAYRREALRVAQVQADKVGNGAGPIALAENALAIFERSLGNHESSLRHVQSAVARIEADGVPLRVWAIRWNQAAAWIEHGHFDRAAEGLESAHRVATTYGGDRFIPFLIGLEARLHERMGDFVAAREAFGRMRAVAPAAGEGAILIADEGLMRAHGALREFGEAGEAWTRAAHRRQRTGIVAAPFERALATPVLRQLRERLDPRPLAAPKIARLV